jgi:Protein of unknown function (DUF732)
MRLLVALLGFVSAIGFAVPAYADSGVRPDNDAFLNALRHAGIDYASSTQAIASAQTVCELVDHGESGLAVIEDLRDRNPAFRMSAAAEFAKISAQFYCPQQLEPTPK